MGMSWGDYGVLEGTGVQRTVLGRATAATMLLTGRGVVPPVPSSALTEVGLGVHGPPKDEPGVITRGSQPCGGATSPASVSALNEGDGGRVGGFESRRTVPSLSALSGAVARPAGAPGRGSPAARFGEMGTTHDLPAAASLSALSGCLTEGGGEAETASPDAGTPGRTVVGRHPLSASDCAYTLPPKAGMVSPVPRAGRAQQ